MPEEEDVAPETAPTAETTADDRTTAQKELAKENTASNEDPDRKLEQTASAVDVTAQQERQDLVNIHSANQVLGVFGNESNRARKGKLYGRAKTKAEGQRYTVMEIYLEVMEIGKEVRNSPAEEKYADKLRKMADLLQQKKQEAVASNEQLDLQASVSVSCSDFLKLVNEKLEETERLKRYRVGGFVLNAPRRRQAVTF